VSVLPLQNTIRDYAWGSREFIYDLLGLPATDTPAAELWLGAHPATPSRLADGTSLVDAIAADPVGMLGEAGLKRFGEALPFLLKVLAADAPLSIQAHPTIEQARAGFSDENARGIAIGAPNRNYADANHKPELICALTDFEALCGFRDVDDSAALLAAIISAGGAALSGYPQRLTADGGLREVVTALLTMPEVHRVELQASVLPACAAVAEARSAWSAECAWTGRLAEAYPGDAGVILALLMNLVRLTPGEALFLSAGRIHAYLRGAGVEIMASSDNVLRCGLTAKHVDVPELLRVLDFTTEHGRPLQPRSDGAIAWYPVPVEDFSLGDLRLNDGQEVQLPPDGPRILLCTDGSFTVAAAPDVQTLLRGQSAFVPAGSAVALSGAGQLFVAGTNLQTVKIEI
jgi:mannose-6-phosphate isomerase